MFAEILAMIFDVRTLNAAIRLSTPIALAALGGAFSERAGIINIGLEGMLLTGAFAGALGSYITGSAVAGLLVAVIAGAAVAGILSVFTVEFGANHVVAGVGINILALGMTTWMMQVIWDSRGTTPAVPRLNAISIPIIRDIPLIGPVVGEQSPFVYLMLALIAGGWFVLFKTPLGLRIRMTGENPEAADTLGINVRAIKHFSVILGGALCGVGGAYLSIGSLGRFSNNMVAGRGFMGLAANIFGQWNPVGGLGASLLFSYADAVQIRLQGLEIALPHNIIQMIPYILTIIILAGGMVRSRPPAALGNSYRSGAGGA